MTPMSPATADRASLAERRARLDPWLLFADQASVVGGVYEGARLCTACDRVIGEGELDFLIVLAGAVALRVDRECLDLWHEAVKNADKNRGQDDDTKVHEELVVAVPLTALGPRVPTCARL